MFSTGQVTEGAVNYTNSTAVCGLNDTGDDPTIANNRTNLTLPQVQACAQPIGPKWVSSITNWLCYVIDAAGLEYASGRVCQNPFLLVNAITALIVKTGGNVIIGQATAAPATPPHTPVPPSDTVGADGQYFMERGTGNVWGPKHLGAWPTSPSLFDKGRVIGVTAAASIGFYNAYVEIRPATGASDWGTEMPAAGPDNGGDWMRILNASNVNQTLTSAGGDFYNFLEGILSVGAGGASTLVLKPGQSVLLVSNNLNWVVYEDSLSVIDIANLVPALGAPPISTDFIVGAHADGTAMKFTIAQLQTALGL